MGISLQRAREEGRELFRPSEVAQMGGYSEAFIYRLIKTGQLEHVRTNDTVRIPFAAVERLLTEGLN